PARRERRRPCSAPARSAEVEPALESLPAPPAAPAGAGEGAGLTADGVETLVPQRIHDDVVVGDVAGDVVVAPVDDGVDLDEAPRRVPLEGGRPRPARRLRPAQPGYPRRPAGQMALQRGHLAGLTARLRPVN